MVSHQTKEPIKAGFLQHYTEGTILRGVVGPKVLAPPPTAHTNIFFLLFWAAVYTLGEYKFFYPGFF